ncbi:MAG: GNAT family N-acetyltransferase [Silvibacterium sp.]|nr:GNAT family N-acetyltransferase [Silvibacterium sp.]
MTQQPLPQLRLIPATPEHEAVLDNLLQLYIYDFTDLLDLDPGADGRFSYPQLSLYWIEPGRYPFLVLLDETPAGFVLVKTGSDWDVHDMAEFFILRRYRRHGMGTRIAHEVWRCLPGRWEVRVMEVNKAALHFWQYAVSSFTGLPAVPIRMEQDGVAWQVFSFESGNGT